MTTTGSDRPPVPRSGHGPPDGEPVAAVDLGSNSFHLVVARVVGGQLHIVDRLRERVALADGLRDDKRLEPAVVRRALETLRRFGARIADMPRANVRAVGTNTLRVARNRRAFLAKAERVLGVPVEVISGREEARLIYLGVAHDVQDDGERRLVVDIGGGSTELIVGEGFEPLAADSIYVGCVTHSRRFFAAGRIRERELRAAELGAALELQSLERRFTSLGWRHCIGSSGTILAAEAVCRAHGWGPPGRVTARALRKLRRALLDAGDVRALAQLPGLPPDRATVFPGGVAILSALFERLGIDAMSTSQGALREGILYDWLGRSRHEDVRERTVRAWAERYHVDADQAARVENTALALLDEVATDWGLEGQQWRQSLRWAARLHEIGIAVAYSGYHKHGAYLIEHGEMPGFSREDQVLLAGLVRVHRRKLRAEVFDALPASRAERALRLAVLLRIAVRLHRARSPRPAPPLRASAHDDRLVLRLPSGYLEDHPLLAADLAEEAEALERIGMRLVVR
ncbi:MAG: Ppx/GppA family phosphatase [Myxococcota bacterium]|nr:Ppx/GppA family phosphatase [Myxococcota bacterium]MDW8360865.1 Ppx/GppA phosphatase family protein [Myxococcales bacterium]